MMGGREVIQQNLDLNLKTYPENDVIFHEYETILQYDYDMLQYDKLNLIVQCFFELVKTG